MKTFIFVISCLLFISISLLSQDEISYKKSILTQKLNILSLIEQNISKVRSEFNTSKENLSKIENIQKKKELDYNSKKNAFERASKNIDLVPADKFKRISLDFKLSDKELREVNSILQNYKIAYQKVDHELNLLIDQKNQIKEDILKLKAEIFDIEVRNPVWVIGEATCYLADSETPNQCRDRALTMAKRDAMEKGGNMILESETIVKNYKLYFDKIRTYINAQIIEQDNNSQYGVKREVIGNNIRYIAKLRLKVQSINSYNPYREQLLSNYQKTISNSNLHDLESQVTKKKDNEKLILSKYEVKTMLNKEGFYDKELNKKGRGKRNIFEMQIIQYDRVVIDKESSLMWQQSGSYNCMSFEDAKKWVVKLDFAGFKDWRLPTLEEAMSLMEPEQKNGDLYIDPLFSKKQIRIWTDTSEKSNKSQWVVSYYLGSCFYVNYWGLHYVRAVRSSQ